MYPSANIIGSRKSYRVHRLVRVFKAVRHEELTNEFQNLQSFCFGGIQFLFSLLEFLQSLYLKISQSH